MPPAITINKKMILQSAFDIARTEGISSLSARRIAAFLNCSTKPIYREFGSMDQLESELMSMISSYALDIILNYNETEYIYYNIGLGYLHLAEQEKELYKILFLSEKNVMDFLSEKYILNSDAQIEQMKKDPLLAEFSESQLKDLFVHMLIFTHGISSMLACNSLAANKEQIHHMINSAFWAYSNFLKSNPQ